MVSMTRCDASSIPEPTIDSVSHISPSSLFVLGSHTQALSLPAKRVGKLICAPTAADAHHLEKLLATGTANGVKGLEILTGEQVLDHAQC